MLSEEIDRMFAFLNYSLITFVRQIYFIPGWWVVVFLFNFCILIRVNLFCNLLILLQYRVLLFVTVLKNSGFKILNQLQSTAPQDLVDNYPAYVSYTYLFFCLFFLISEVHSFFFSFPCFLYWAISSFYYLPFEEHDCIYFSSVELSGFQIYEFDMN